MIYLRTFESFEEFDNVKGDRFWGDTGAGILPICEKTGRILVPYRSKFVNEPHTWGGGFGGKLDNEENPENAAERELREETGYYGKLEIIPAYVFTSLNKTFKYYNFIGLVDNEFTPILDWETEKAMWMSLAELKNLKPKHFGLESFLKNSMVLIKSTHINISSNFCGGFFFFPDITWHIAHVR